MKVYIMTDMEGTSGIVEFAHCKPTSPFYEKGKRLTTLEVNAAIEGILDTGKHDIVVCDGHGSGAIDIELLHPEARLIMGRPLDPMFQIDAEAYDAFMMIGQHAMKNAPVSNLDHTFNSTTISSLSINGLQIGEAGVNALRAGIYGIPTVYLSGDQAACDEVTRIIPDIHTCAVKKAITSTSAVCIQPEKARNLIRGSVNHAIKNMGGIKPYKLESPYEAVFEYFDPSSLDAYRDKKYCKILSDTKVSIYADTMEELLRGRLWGNEK